MTLRLTVALAILALTACDRKAATTTERPLTRADASAAPPIDAGAAGAVVDASPVPDAAAPAPVEALPPTRGRPSCKPVRDTRDDADPLALEIEVCTATPVASTKASKADPDHVVVWLRRPVAGASKVLWWQQVDRLVTAYLTYYVDAKLPGITVIVSSLREPPDNDGDGKPDRLDHRFGTDLEEDFGTWDIFMRLTPDASAVVDVAEIEDSGD